MVGGSFHGKLWMSYPNGNLSRSLWPCYTLLYLAVIRLDQRPLLGQSELQTKSLRSDVLKIGTGCCCWLASWKISTEIWWFFKPKKNNNIFRQAKVNW
jgi:hypothetical protein